MTVIQTTGTTATPTTAARTTGATASARPVRSRRLQRLALVVGAGVTNAVIFLVARAAGTDFTITDPGPAGKAHTFAAPEIAVITVICALAGWLTLAALERWTRRPRAIWSGLALAVVLLSLVPIGIEQATTSTRIMLGVIHAMAAVALLPMLRSSSKR